LNITETQAIDLKKMHFPDKSAELKFADMKSGKNFYRARNMIESLLKAQAVRVLVIDKRFALSAKMFEWIAEPSLSEQTDLYSEGFLPKMVSRFHITTVRDQPVQLLSVHQAYQRAVKLPNVQHIQALVDALEKLEAEPGEMARAYLIPPLDSEGAALFNDYGITEGLNGILISAAWQNLLRWGATFEEDVPIEVVYDNNSVMQKEQTFWRQATAASLDMQANGYAFSLRQPVTTRLGDSTKEMGLQIADVVAGFAAFAVHTRAKFADRDRPDRPIPGLIAYELLSASQFANEQPLITVEAGEPERFSGWTISR